MLLAQTQDTFNSIISLSEHICSLINDQDIGELEKKIPEYTEKIENYFFSQHQQDLSQTDLDALKELISSHKKMTDLISDEKIKIFKKIKKLHIGKEMQNTYP